MSKMKFLEHIKSTMASLRRATYNIEHVRVYAHTHAKAKGTEVGPFMNSQLCDGKINISKQR